MYAIIKVIGSLRLTVVCLLLLAGLVFWGTLYQIDAGLYAAQVRFYNSWVFFALGVVPLPGTQLVLTVLFLNLLVAMLDQIRYTWRRAGIVMIHAGLLVMLGGGFLIHHHAEESFLTLIEGEGSNLSSSYRDWELAAWKPAEGEQRTVVAADTAGWKAGQEVALPDVGLRGRVRLYYPNARAFTQGEGEFTSVSGIKAIEWAKPSKEPTENLPALVLEMQEGGEDMLLYGGDSAPTVIELDGEQVALSLRRRRFELPLAVRLVDFRKETHPNSDIAKSYSSVVAVDAPGGLRNVLIEMNKPLRYKGYTFYQASYSSFDDGREASTFAVVKNYGRLLPYIATVITFLGLLIHFMVEIWRRSYTDEAVSA